MEIEKHCQHCNTKKAYSNRHRELTPIVSQMPRERYVIDFIDMRKDSDVVEHDVRYQWILHMIDHASRYRFAQACKTKHAAAVQRVVK